MNKYYAATLFSVLTLAGGTSWLLAQNTVSNRWDTTPLGPQAPALEWKPAAKKRSLKSNLKILPAKGQTLILARNNQPTAKIVIPADNDANTRQAAVILQQMWQKISGARLPIVLENTLDQTDNTQPLVSLGATDLAKKANIVVSDLQPEGYRLSSGDNTLFIIGNDKSAEGAVQGTRNGVYALLERHFDCRWLWPGELGEVYPQVDVLKIGPISEQDEPALIIRHLRNGYPGSFSNFQPQTPSERHKTGLNFIGRSVESFNEKTVDSGHWFETMRLGQSFNLNYRHAYGALWGKYGKRHPEYFALQPDETRDQSIAPRQARLCVSNDALIKTIADDLIQRFKKDPQLISLSISPNDGGPQGFCMCENCRRLDPPNGPEVILNLGIGKRGSTYVSLTDRYVTFYGKIAERVQKELPDRKLGAYAYSAYKTPPLQAKLPSNVIVGFVGLGYLNDAAREADLQNWDLWSRAARQLMLRPNALLDGHGFPVLYPHRLGEDIKHTYQTGMMGVDFDSVQHNWAGQGLNYYVLARLAWDPSLDVNEIVRDYTEKGFGSAAPTIQKYFAAIEELTDTIAKEDVNWEHVALQITQTSRYRQLLVLTNAFNDQKIEALKKLLDQAKSESGGDAKVLARIDFLSQALRYTRAQTKPWRLVLKMMADPAVSEDASQKKALIEALKERETVLGDIYDHHFYAQSMVTLMSLEKPMWERYGWKN